MSPRHPQAGVTLVEVLVVLAILGVASTAAVLGVTSAARDRSAEEEARRLAAQITLAVDEGLTGAVPMQLSWTPGAYQVRRLAPEGWTPARTERLSPHDLPPGVTLQRRDGRPDPLDIAPDGMGAAVTLDLVGPAPWSVAFDGLTARAEATP